MDISKYTAEDFVLDQEFRLWILFLNTESNILWDKLLIEYPSHFENVKIAREILLNLTIEKHSIIETESRELWDLIDLETERYGFEEIVKNVVPLNSGSTLKRYEKQHKEGFRITQVHRIAAILVVAFGLSILAKLIFPTPPPVEEEANLVYEEHSTPPGVKSTLTLHDGSKVILNSGSTLKYVKNFEADKRILYLNGEALTVDLEAGKVHKGPFGIDQEIGWTQEKIIFEQVKLSEAIRVIENWYGAKFIFKNKPDPALLLSGIYQDEMLENVLEGLSYTARFDFKINEDIVTVKFN